MNDMIPQKEGKVGSYMLISTSKSSNGQRLQHFTTCWRKWTLEFQDGAHSMFDMISFHKQCPLSFGGTRWKYLMAVGGPWSGVNPVDLTITLFETTPFTKWYSPATHEKKNQERPVSISAKTENLIMWDGIGISVPSWLIWLQECVLKCRSTFWEAFCQRYSFLF